MQVPSGRTFHQDDIKLLALMNDYGFVRYSDQPFTLKSGIKSHVYVYGREDITDHPDLAWQIGRKISNFMQTLTENTQNDKRQICLIGIPTAGTALAAATQLLSYYSRGSDALCYRIMREVKKSHGVHQAWINGKPDLERHDYWLVDNVATDGQSKLEADKKAIEDGYPARLPCLIFVDRQQGALGNLKQNGFQRVEIIYSLLDLTFAFGELGLWPKETVGLVEREIAEHCNLAFKPTA
jgi:orotate phosphoribosyltransferase